MYNYLRELHRCSNTEPDCTTQRTEISSLQSELKTHLGDAERKLLLCITDAQGVLSYEISLESFAAGFRTAAKLFCETEAHGGYSYEDAETERIVQTIRGKDCDTP